MYAIVSKINNKKFYFVKLVETSPGKFNSRISSNIDDAFKFNSSKEAKMKYEECLNLNAGYYSNTGKIEKI